MTKIKLKITLFLMLMVFSTQIQAEENILCIQKFLAKTVFNPGPSDGLWGKKTETAINQLISQANNFKSPNFKKSDAENVCKMLQGNQALKLLEIGQFKRFPIEILADIGEIKSVTDFDFSKIDISNNINYNCNFVILHRKGFKRASGKVQIDNGKLVFKTHKWKVGLASEGSQRFLIEEANLKLTQNGLRGIMPHLSYVGEGEVAKPVQYITLGENYIKVTKPSTLEAGILGSNNYIDSYGTTYTFKILACSEKFNRTKKSMNKKLLCLQKSFTDKGMGEVLSSPGLELLSKAFIKDQKNLKDKSDLIKIGLDPNAVNKNEKHLLKLVNHEGSNFLFCRKLKG